MSNIAALTNDNFDDIIANGDKPILVEFWAPWCVPCKGLLPILEQVATEVADKGVICKVDADEQIELVSRFSISAVPTLLLFKNGNVVKKLTGTHSKKVLKALFEDAA